MVPIAWVRTALEEQEEVLGPDPWAYGLTPANRKNLETVLRYTHQQGMISRMPSLDACSRIPISATPAARTGFDVKSRAYPTGRARPRCDHPQREAES